MVGLSSSVVTGFATVIAVLLLAPQAMGDVEADCTGGCLKLHEASLLQLSTGRAAVERVLHSDPNLIKESSIDAQNLANTEGLNRTALELFEKLRLNFQKQFPPYGRIPRSEPSPDALTLDFEFETRAFLEVTPEILLERGGLHRDSYNPELQKSSSRMLNLGGVSWPKPSKLFTIGLDGHGQPNGKGQWRQSLNAVIELESVLMSPKEALDGKLGKHVQIFMRRLQSEKLAKGSIFPLPFKGSSGIRINPEAILNAKEMIDPNKPCVKCNVQWTAGLSLKHVSKLLRMSPYPVWQETIANADSLCSRKQDCRPEYHAFISLAAVVLHRVRDCPCGHPKRCLKAWLLRTHFGDLAMYIKNTLGEHAFESIHEDVLAVGNFSGHESVLPNGIMDYLRLPEFAEVAGMVFPRKPSLDKRYEQTEQDIPTDVDGLLHLSDQVLQNRALVEQRLANRECHLHSRSRVQHTGFTVNDWLAGLLLGKDLMSDHDSELSKSSFSHLVWKSMGSWRMKPGSDRVYLECRHTENCLPDMRPRFSDPGPGGLIHLVAQRMQLFERGIASQA